MGSRQSSFPIASLTSFYTRGLEWAMLLGVLYVYKYFYLLRFYMCGSIFPKAELISEA